MDLALIYSGSGMDLVHEETSLGAAHAVKKGAARGAGNRLRV